MPVPQRPPPGPGYQPPAGSPPYARPQQSSSGKILAGVGCTTLIIVLVILLICGGLAYGAYLLLRNAANQAVQQAQTTTSNGQNSSSSGSSATAIPTRTFPINATITYSSVQITIVNAQLGASFADDQNRENQNLILRLNIQENNPTGNGIGYNYHDAAHLILSDKSSVATTAEEHFGPPPGQASQSNWLDFSVPPTISVDKTILRLGTPTEAQMDVPLISKPNLSAYADRTVNNPANAQTTYAHLTWTITAATLSWSADGKQASANQRFVIVTLSIDNNTNQDFNASYHDYLRLQAGTTRAAPLDSTLPITIAGGSTKQTGWVLFPVPQNVSSFTLIFLASEFTRTTQDQSINFQIP
jgi:hypothetical protein